MVIPRDKLVRAAGWLRQLLEEGIPFDRYQCLCGLLEHFRHVNCASSSTMLGMYAPHPQGALEGPGMLVIPNPFMRTQAEALELVVARSGGAPLSAAIRPPDLQGCPPLAFVSSADAATDSEVPGLGGY